MSKKPFNLNEMVAVVGEDNLIITYRYVTHCRQLSSFVLISWIYYIRSC